MSLIVAVAKENREAEHRVALVPEVAAKLAALEVEARVEKGAGEAAGFPDSAYEKGGCVSRDQLFDHADMLWCVRAPTVETVTQLQSGAVLIGLLNPYHNDELIKACADKGVSSFAMEWIPRISRAQSMDVLSSQAAIAGYKAALIAANHAGYFFPMLTTAAGTVRPAKVLVIGAGVAGLQALATCRRLGAQVSGYDVRPETEEQVKSLGAKFLKLEVQASGAGGYARELSEDEKQQQSELLGDSIATMNVVITTASVPGKPAPKIVSRDMVERMQPGSVIVDLAAEGGGNCELTQPAEVIEHAGVLIDGPLDVPSRLAHHASILYARNLLNFVTPMIEGGQIKLDFDDEVIAASCVTHNGEIKRHD